MVKSAKYFDLLHLDLLKESWLKVKAKDSSGGIDNLSISQFEENANENISDLLNDLANDRYLPLPYRKVEIDKGADETRILGLLSIKDKVVQHAIKRLIEPAFENIFLDVSYAYREGKGALKAISRVKHILQKDNNSWLISLDIDDFFDSIPHDLLFKKLKTIVADPKLLTLIELCVKMGKVGGLQWQDANKGVPQGAILSPLLANLYLHELDVWMVQKKLGYVRYADDFIILCSVQNQAESALKKTLNLIKTLQVKVNEGYKIAPINEGFDFLGIQFKGGQISLSEKKKGRLIEKITIALANDHYLPGNQFAKILKSITNYYAKLVPPMELAFIDEKIISIISEKATFKSKKEANEKLANLIFVTNTFNDQKKLHVIQIISSIQRKQKTPKKVATLVNKRKREYQAIEAKHSELVIKTIGAFIGKNKKGIVVKVKGKTIASSSMANLQHITILSKGVTLSSDVIEFCTQKNIAIDFFTHTGKQFARLYAPVNADHELWMHQLNAHNNGNGISLAKQITIAKITNQHNLIKYYHKYHKKQDSTFEKFYALNAEKFKTIRQEIKNLEPCHISELRLKIMAAEGRAAAVYWDMIKELIDDDTNFEGRVRKGAKDLVNSLLNYGYAILYSRISIALAQARLNPCISYLHTPQEGKPTLVYDMVEYFRQQAVDRVVFSLIQKHEKLELKGGLLEEETRNKLITHIYERLHRYENYRGEQKKLLQIMELQAKEFAHYLTGKSKKFKPYIAKW